MESEIKKEAIIRSEAKEFAKEAIEDTMKQYLGHKRFRDKMVLEVTNFYLPESKIVFLDQLIDEVRSNWNEHQSTCRETKSGKVCPRDESYEKMLFYIGQEIDSLPHYVRTNQAESKAKRDRVFISYSHKDREWLEKFRRHFRPFEGIVDIWDDTKIGVGNKWEVEINKAIECTKIAVLLISADFFNSDFIMKRELPALFQAANEDGATIVPVILKPCLFSEYPISQYQAINSPDYSLIQMDEANQELIWIQLVKTIKKLITV